MENTQTKQDPQKSDEALAAKKAMANKDEIKEDVEKLKKDLEEANKKLEEMTDSAKRAMADLQNSKKRMEEEKQAFAKFAAANVFLEILPVFDSLDRANSQLPDELKDDEWVKGVQGISKQFEQIMEKFHIKKMKAKGKKFDPNLHEAVAQGPGEKDIILEELEAGYIMEDHTLRPARVKVGDGKPTNSQ